MSRRPLTFRQNDVARAIKGAVAGGLTVQRVEVDKAGKIIDSRPTFTHTSMFVVASAITSGVRASDGYRYPGCPTLLSSWRPTQWRWRPRQHLESMSA